MIFVFSFFGVSAADRQLLFVESMTNPSFVWRCVPVTDVTRHTKTLERKGGRLPFMHQLQHSCGGACLPWLVAVTVTAFNYLVLDNSDYLVGSLPSEYPLYIFPPSPPLTPYSKEHLSIFILIPSYIPRHASLNCSPSHPHPSLRCLNGPETKTNRFSTPSHRNG
jgi:hypothetical protein